MKKISFVGVLFLLPVFGFADVDLNLEQLLGVTVNEEGITFQVSSNGCTEKPNFQFGVQILEPLSPMLPALEHHHYITVARMVGDSCENFVPYGTSIFMSFEELGISFGKFHIKNPIGGDMIQ